MKYFTYLWPSKTWKKKASETSDSTLGYASSDLFAQAKVMPDCTVFIATVKDGYCYLGGYIKVGVVTDRAGASEILGIADEDLSDGQEFIIAKEDTVQPFRADLKLDADFSRGLEFAKEGGGFVNLKLDKDGLLKSQTLRGVRRLYTGEEKKLMELLKA